MPGAQDAPMDQTDTVPAVMNPTVKCKKFHLNDDKVINEVVNKKEGRHCKVNMKRKHILELGL